MKTIFLIDSCSDLPLSFIEENSDCLDIIGMPVEIDGKDYIDDFGKTLTHEEFYKFIRKGIMPTTSQINSHRFLEKFKKHSDDGNSIIYIGFTSGMSGTYNSAMVAKEMLLEENPNADITLVDTRCASVGEGLLILYAVEMLKNGSSKDEILNWIEGNKLKSNHWFAVDDLTFLKKGGRISATSAAVGTLLKVKPILTVDNEGKLKSYTNVRGRKKSLNFLIEKSKEHIIDSENSIIIIGHGDCIKEAKKLEKEVQNELNPRKIIITQLSSTIASHVGPDMISLAFIGEARENI